MQSLRAANRNMQSSYLTHASLVELAAKLEEEQQKRDSFERNNEQLKKSTTEILRKINHQTADRKEMLSVMDDLKESLRVPLHNLSYPFGSYAVDFKANLQAPISLHYHLSKDLNWTSPQRNKKKK